MEIPDSAAPPVPTQPSATSRPRAVLGPVLAPSAFQRASKFAPGEVPSVLAALGFDLSRLVPTQAEKDAFYRDKAARYARSRDVHRPVAASGMGAGMSLPLPLFSSGPSRKERARDSVIHQGNLLRLRHLEERAKAKRDSLRVADSTRRERIPPP